MKPYLRFVGVAFASILIGVPLWAFVLAPEEFSLTFFTEVGFWMAAAIGMALLLFGFWLGQRTDLA